MAYIQPSLFGKTSQELFHQETGWISTPFLKRSQTPKFQCLVLDDGQTPEWFESPEVAVTSHGASWTPNIGELPNAAVESSLSQILEQNVPPKYFLSAKACKGILNRAERRGKELPLMLKSALLQRCEGTKGDPFDGKGALISSEKSFTLGTSNDQTLIVQNDPQVWSACGHGDGETSPTLVGGHAGRTSNTAPVVAAFMGGQGEKAGGLGYQEQMSPTLKASSSGKNQTPSIVYAIEGNGARPSHNGSGFCQNVSPTLNTTERHAVCFEKYRHAEYREGVGTLRRNAGVTEAPLCVAHGQAGAEMAYDLSPTLDCNHEQPYIVQEEPTLVVRRLTPRECERLMNFPDDWTLHGHDGKQISDSERYRALGNSICSCCIEHITAAIAATEEPREGENT